MDLTRKRTQLVMAVGYLLLGLWLLLTPGSELLAMIGGGLLVVAGGGLLVVAVVRPFRFRIDADGLDVRVPGLRRMLAWHEIDAIVLCRPPGPRWSPWLLLVPAAGVLDRPLTDPSPVDGRKGLLLLDLGTVRQPVDEVTAALTRFGGGRFVDGRRHRQPTAEPPSFTTSLRGYDKAQIDELVGRGLDAVASGIPTQRAAVRAQIESARTDLAVSLRGYDTTEVDAYLDRLSADLAADPGPRAD
ncbi:DivIVA domain-containing protein [Micromonospora sp. NPDC047134]|uniref:DivIVA domain-containing protein n=1 Tax=Micromonospora sp. NPDC047134 TaxID=3154340 RepID=UPI0034076CBA